MTRTTAPVLTSLKKSVIGAAVPAGRQIAPLTVSSDSDPEAVSRLPVGTTSVTISIGARGQYPALLAFVDELHALDRLVVVDLVDLTSDEEDTSQVIMDVELRIFTTEQLVQTPELDEFDDGFVDDGSFDGGSIDGLPGDETSGSDG